MLFESLPDPTLSTFQSVLQSRYRVAQYGKAFDPAVLSPGASKSTFSKTKLVSYERYWHGYQVFLMPLLELTSYNGIRLLNGVLLFALVLFLAFLIVRKGYSRAVALLFALALFLTSCFVVPFSLQFVGVFYIALVGMIALLLFDKHKPDNIRIKITFLLLGMLTSFIDFLTAPVVALAVPLLMLVVINHKYLTEAARRKKFYKTLVLNTLIWIAGYALLWISKWVLAGLFSANKGAVGEGFSRVLSKMGSGGLSATITLYLKAMVWNIVVLVPGTSNQRVVLRLASILVFMLLIGVLWYVCFRRTRGAKNDLSQNLPFLLVALIPTLWILAFPAQTSGVFMYVNRAHLATVYGLLLFGYYSVDWKRLKRGSYKKTDEEELRA